MPSVSGLPLARRTTSADSAPPAYGEGIGLAGLQQDAAQPRVRALRQRHAREALARLGDQALVLRERRAHDAAAEQRLQVRLEVGALLARERGADLAVHVGQQPGLQEVGVVALGVVQHQVGLERLVAVLGVVLRGLAQRLLHALRRLRQQHALERALVDAVGRGLQLLALVKAEAVAEGRIADVELLRLGQVAQPVEDQQRTREVAARVDHGRQLAARRGAVEGLRVAVDLGHVLLVVVPAVDAGAQQRHQQHADHAVAHQVGRALAPIPAQVGAGHARVAEDHLLQQLLEEVALARARRRRRRRVDLQVALDRAHHAVEGRALLRAAGEVDAAQHRRGLELRRVEHVGQEGAEDVLEARELLRQQVGLRAAHRVGLGGQQLGQALVEPLVQQPGSARAGRCPRAWWRCPRACRPWRAWRWRRSRRSGR